MSIMNSRKAFSHTDYKRLSLCLLHEKGTMLSQEYKLNESNISIAITTEYTHMQ